MSAELWCVYQAGGRFAARRFDVSSNPPAATSDLIVRDSLRRVRFALAIRGLVRRPRSEGDAPAVVETWRAALAGVAGGGRGVVDIHQSA